MTAKDILVQMVIALKRLIRMEDVRGDPINVQGRQLIPLSQRIRIGGFGSGGGGGVVWNRPIAITEEIEEGIYRHYHIRDETLRALIGVFLSVLVFRFALTIMFGRR
jgi:hypothetical protein